MTMHVVQVIWLVHTLSGKQKCITVVLSCYRLDKMGKVSKESKEWSIDWGNINAHKEAKQSCLWERLLQW